jgi:hypothetical protein
VIYPRTSLWTPERVWVDGEVLYADNTCGGFYFQKDLVLGLFYLNGTLFCYCDNNSLSCYPVALWKQSGTERFTILFRSNTVTQRGDDTCSCTDVRLSCSKMGMGLILAQAALTEIEKGHLEMDGGGLLGHAVLGLAQASLIGNAKGALLMIGSGTYWGWATCSCAGLFDREREGES